MFLTPLETDDKQILRRCAPQNDIATSPQATGGKPTTPIFEGGHEEHEVKKFENINFRILRVLRALLRKFGWGWGLCRISHR